LNKRLDIHRIANLKYIYKIFKVISTVLIETIGSRWDIKSMIF